LPAEFAHIVAPGRIPRVARYGSDGRVVWSTDVDLGEIAQHMVVTDGQIHRKRRRPRTIVMTQWQPLMVSADRVAVTYEDYSSGVCVTFFLDTASGALVSRTRPAPQGLKAIVAPGEFLIGTHGYSASSTTRYDRSGQALRQWASHGMMLVDRHGGIRGPEYENSRRSQSRFRELIGDGTLVDGPVLSGFYTTYPALDSVGTAVFWRDGRLITVDAKFEERELFAGGDDRQVMDRVLLLAEGRVVFTLGGELLIFGGTGLGALDSGVWACGDGGLCGNPVAYQ
jgi:opacity protein-like surface antigen